MSRIIRVDEPNHLAPEHDDPNLWGSIELIFRTTGVDRSFSILNKVLAKDRNFCGDNVEKYLIKLCSFQHDSICHLSSQVLLSMEIITVYCNTAVFMVCMCNFSSFFYIHKKEIFTIQITIQTK